MAGSRLPVLPDDDFSEIAVDLGQYVTAFSDAAMAWETQIGRGLVSPGVEHTLRETAKSARRCSQIRQFFIDMIPHEQEFRDFVAGLAMLEQDDRRIG